MGGEQAANVLVQVKLAQLEKEGKKPSEDKVNELRTSIQNSFEDESCCYFSTARMWDDGIILPQETRKVLGLSLLVTSGKGSPTKHGVFRM